MFKAAIKWLPFSIAMYMPSVIYIDVDDTLVRSVGKTRIPMPAVISHIRYLKDAGFDLYLWSSGGTEYCRQTAVELGIEDCFVAFLPKPNIYVDDQPIHEWKRCRHLYPLQITSIDGPPEE
jgi:hypothetical protein